MESEVLVKLLESLNMTKEPVFIVIKMDSRFSKSPFLVLMKI
jgi:hypothetical protein